jgi:hypothetical protein
MTDKEKIFMVVVVRSVEVLTMGAALLVRKGPGRHEPVEP